MSALAAATRLRDELEELSKVLVSGDGTVLVSMEERLAQAIDGLSKDHQVESDQRGAVLGALLGARAALIRCRTLGAGLGHVVQATLAARGQQANYDQHAGLASALQSVRGGTIDARL